MTATAGGREVALEVPHDISAPTTARQFVLLHLADRSSQMRDDVALLVSELVTNAVRYGRPEVTVRLVLDRSGVRVEIHDHGVGVPQLPTVPPPPGRPGGRGLLIVDAVASRWGVLTGSDDSGKTVWFELGGAVA